MTVQLFSHNQKAYEAALAVMEESGKAAIIHPTGTGKSFIGFKLASDHPEARVIWLGPSEAIFKTQIENLQAAGGEDPQNVAFLTYARLMGLTQGELDELKPHFIILDEFHRCGAEQWGKGVDALLKTYPDVPILGLSATNIRYLDNQRDMADELFDNHIASEMTLGEAISRGILAAPKYITTVYKYKKELNKYEKRIRKAKSPATRDAAEDLLEKLRRALEKADGLDDIFARHIPDRNGKYLVFCANAEHMAAMKDQADKWFHKVDAEPHLYTAYSEDPLTDKAFAAFKADHSSHLKLLYCIDMFNEGIHVDDVAGVILFRPTVSPIIYKQQIGRALSAGKGTEPVIFDIINNFDNLYSIQTIQNEMRDALCLYRERGEKDQIVEESFTLIDEVQDCRRLFTELNEVLGASWNQMYRHAELYYEEHGNLEVPVRYTTPEGYALGGWIATQRKVRAGTRYGSLSENRIKKLDAIGMVWEPHIERQWIRNFEEAKAYYQKNGNLDIPTNYVTETGIPLGGWIENQRQIKRRGQRSTTLTPERVEQLNDIGMIWDKFSLSWEQQYLACVEYFDIHGDCDIPRDYMTKDGLKTGAWVRRIRAIRSGRMPQCADLTPNQIDRLNAIHFIWEDTYTRRWQYGYEQAKAYFQEYGNLNPPASYTSPQGFNLYKWLVRQRKIKQSEKRKNTLKAIGYDFDPPDGFEVRLALCRSYYHAHGDLNPPSDYRANGIWLARWINEQRRIYRGKVKGRHLTEEQIKGLEAAGMDWRTASERAWENQFQAVEKYVKTTGQPIIPMDLSTQEGKRMRLWLNRQKKADIQGKLNTYQKKKLYAIGCLEPDDHSYSQYRDSKQNWINSK